MTQPMTASNWSRWVFVIEPGSKHPSLAEVKANIARFGKPLFGPLVTSTARLTALSSRTAA